MTSLETIYDGIDSLVSRHLWTCVDSSVWEIIKGNIIVSPRNSILKALTTSVMDTVIDHIKANVSTKLIEYDFTKDC